MKRFALICAAAVLGLFSLSSGAIAQSYPAKPITLVVPFSPGGATDINARIFADALGERLGQTVIVENRPGGNGVIGTQAVQRADADGYTLLFSYPGAMTVNPSLFSQLPYDPMKDFAPVSLLVNYSFILNVHPSVPATNVKELIALAKEQPGKLQFGIAGIGSTAHLALALFKSMTGIEVTEVPFKGSSGISNELIAGRLTGSFENTATAISNIKSGLVRPLGVTSISRSAIAPDIPTIDEAGVKGYDLTSWYAIMAPAGTPKEVIAVLTENFTAVTKDQKVADRLTGLGMEIVGAGPEELSALIASETEKWRKLIDEAGIKKK